MRDSYLFDRIVDELLPLAMLGSAAYRQGLTIVRTAHVLLLSAALCGCTDGQGGGDRHDGSVDVAPVVQDGSPPANDGTGEANRLLHFTVVHLEAFTAVTGSLAPDPKDRVQWLIDLVNRASERKVKLTLQLTPQWVDLFAQTDRTEEVVEAVKQGGHAFGYHHHGIIHADWDGHTALAKDAAAKLFECWMTGSIDPQSGKPCALKSPDGEHHGYREEYLDALEPSWKALVAQSQYQTLFEKLYRSDMQSYQEAYDDLFATWGADPTNGTFGSGPTQITDWICDLRVGTTHFAPSDYPGPVASIISLQEYNQAHPSQPISFGSCKDISLLHMAGGASNAATSDVARLKTLFAGYETALEAALTDLSAQAAHGTFGFVFHLFNYVEVEKESPGDNPFVGWFDLVSHSIDPRLKIATVEEINALVRQ